MNSPTNSASQDAHAHDPHREDLREADSARLAARRAEVVAALARRVARGQHSDAPRADPTLRMRRSDGVPGAAHGRGAAEDRGAARGDACAPVTGCVSRSWHAARARVFRAARLPHRCGRHAVAREIQQDPLARSAVLYGRGSVRGAQSGDKRGGGSLRPLLRARPEQPDRLHHRRQRRREFRRRALPEVRPDLAQRAARARLHGGGGARRVRLGSARCARPRLCWPSSSAARACSRSPPR